MLHLYISRIAILISIAVVLLVALAAWLRVEGVL